MSREEMRGYSAFADARCLDAAADVVRRRAPKPNSFGAKLIIKFLGNMAAKLREWDK